MPGHEQRDVNLRRVAFVGFSIFGLIGVALVLSMLTYNRWRMLSPSPGAKAETFTVPRALPPDPRLQVSPETDLAGLRASEDSVLLHYAWVSKDSGVVRIPVARAMELLAERGLPVARRAEKNRGQQ